MDGLIIELEKLDESDAQMKQMIEKLFGLDQENIQKNAAKSKIGESTSGKTKE